MNQHNLESQEFYELMQQYRMAPVDNQVLVVQRFEAVKQYLLKPVIEKDGDKKTVREKALLWMANYIHHDLDYLHHQNIFFIEKMTVERIEELYLKFETK